MFILPNVALYVITYIACLYILSLILDALVRSLMMILL